MESALLTPHSYWSVRGTSDAPAERATNRKAQRRSGRTFPPAEPLASARGLSLLASTFGTSNNFSVFNLRQVLTSFISKPSF